MEPERGWLHLRVVVARGGLTERRLVRLWRGCQPPVGDFTLRALGKRPSINPHSDSRRQLGEAPIGAGCAAGRLTCLYRILKKTGMTTLTVTAARQRLGYWLRRADRGENIGVFLGNKVIALRPVAVVSTDYAELEYGLTSVEMDAAAARLVAETKNAATIPYKPGMLTRGNRTHKTLPRGGKASRRR